MSNRQLALNTLKSTINYELYKEPGKIRELRCEKSTNYMIKKFVHLRNDIKTVMNAINKIFYNSGYSPHIPRITAIPDEITDMSAYRDTEYNVNIQWPNEYNRTHMCTIKCYYHYKSDFIAPKILRYLDLCITIQIGILYDPDFVLNIDFPDTSENICGFMFIDKNPKLYQDMTCNINRMMLGKHKVPRYLQDLLTELHSIFDISMSL